MPARVPQNWVVGSLCLQCVLGLDRLLRHPMTSTKKTKNSQLQRPATREEDALFCLSLFVHRYLTAIYDRLGLDLVSLTLLDEIARHNLEPLTKDGCTAFPRDASQVKKMRGCNAFSLSQATGVPRETVRRKIKQLTDLGWIEQHNRKGLFITRQWMERISQEESTAMIGEFRETARRVEKILHG